MRHDAQAGLRLERRSDPLVPEPDALELVAFILECEIGVPGRRDRHPADLALDPQVRETGVCPDGAADRPRHLADGQDPDAERAGRGRLPAQAGVSKCAGRARTDGAEAVRTLRWIGRDGIPARERPVGRVAVVAAHRD